MEIHRNNGKEGATGLVFGHLETEGILMFARQPHGFFGFAVRHVERVDAGHGTSDRWTRIMMFSAMTGALSKSPQRISTTKSIGVKSSLSSHTR